MPRRSDIRRVLVIGSGPIVIGQACEFDYSGTQAIKALKEEGVEVVLLNSNPATVMTDPELAARTYIEPITVEVAERIIALERPDALLPTMGGQTALNLAKALAEAGILAKYGVRLIGASLEAINKAEDRELFKAAMERIGLESPRSGAARTLEEARALAKEMGFPAIIRASFTLGGTGGGVARDAAELDALCAAGLAASPTATVLIEESALGWKEFELEVVRDSADNAIIVCSIENFDPMGVHTGDSITVAPAQTLTDREYQRLRQAALAIVREVGVETGGANVQFAVNPRDGRLVVIEMNPRVSRSSALASKATGYPIARVATKLALGYTLPELRNDITRDTSAAFEPVIDYVVVKIPRFDFEKFPATDAVLTTSMRSVGEVMAIGRTFSEAFAKARRSLDMDPLSAVRSPVLPDGLTLAASLSTPRPDRPMRLAQAFREGWSIDRVHALTSIDPWFLKHLRAEAVEAQRWQARGGGLASVSLGELRAAKQRGFSDAELAFLVGVPEAEVRERRHRHGLRPVYKRVDTCSGEFESHTPYLYSTYEVEDEAPPTARPKVLILGSGPNRIGQGIEFDYCCVHATLALREAGFETVMLNCNPETVSTDFDTSDRLYFEPLTLEDVLEVAQREKPLGVIVQLGGQTPLHLAAALHAAGVPILGTSVDAIDRAEDRERFAEVVTKLGLRQPANGMARDLDEARAVAERLGYPVILRPSYVLGGRAMEVVEEAESLARYLRTAAQVAPDRPVLIDHFLERAIEADLDLVADREGQVRIGGILEHVEEAGVHSGDAACVLPPHSLPPEVIERMKDQAAALARELGVVGLMNVQFAVQGKVVFILEVNPRASRTVPFVAKATGFPLTRIAALCMVGRTLRELNLPPEQVLKHVAVKEAVFPFARFPGVDVLLGPEMRSTGEVMGLADDLPAAFAKSQVAAGMRLPRSGTAFFAVKDDDRPAIVDLARRLVSLGFEVTAPDGARRYLADKGVPLAASGIDQPRQAVERIESGSLAMVVNTVAGAATVADDFALRRASLQRGVPYFTTVEAARLMVAALERTAAGPWDLKPLQDRLAMPVAVGKVSKEVSR